MPFAICRPSDAADHPARIFDESGLQWLKFGRDYFCYCDDALDVAWDRLGAAGVEVTRRHAGEMRRNGQEGLFLVTQEGRLFQRAHADVPVLYDKGRHLVVWLDRRRADGMRRQKARFAIRPVVPNETVFEAEPRPATAPGANPRIRSLVDGASRSNFVATVKELASYPTRHSLSTHFHQAARRTRDRLQLMGYDVRLQDVPLPEGRTCNIIADKQGVSDGERRLTLVTAHLDSVNHPADPSLPDDPTAPAPGADDNASGSAGVIEIARVFKELPLAQDLRLVLFGGEEQSLRGSEHYVKQLDPGERARIVAVVNMDMIAARNAAPRTVLLEGSPVSRAVVQGLCAAAHAYTQLAVNTSLEPHDSDHCSFIDAGIPAVLTIEGCDEANKNIHNANDTPERLDHDLAVEILRMNIAYVAERTGA
jgi:hypothetical protein